MPHTHLRHSNCTLEISVFKSASNLGPVGHTIIFNKWEEMSKWPFLSEPWPTGEFLGSSRTQLHNRIENKTLLLFYEKEAILPTLVSSSWEGCLPSLNSIWQIPNFVIPLILLKIPASGNPNQTPPLSQVLRSDLMSSKPSCPCFLNLLGAQDISLHYLWSSHGHLRPG